MTKHNLLEKRCQFKTKRLWVQTWQSQADASPSEQAFAKKVIEILTPNVTKSLPAGWQGIDTVDKADDWISRRAEEGAFLVIQRLADLEVIGFLFLYNAPSTDNTINLRLGYLLAEAVWGNGLGGELIEGLVNWCKSHSEVKSLAGGVEPGNIGSIKILERNGFYLMKTQDASKDVLFYERRFVD